MSRLRDMRNSCILIGSRGTLEVGTKTDSFIRLSVDGCELPLRGQVVAPDCVAPRTLVDLFRPQLEDFLDAVREGRAPVVPGQEGRQAIGLIEHCYRIRQPLRHAWEAFDSAAPAAGV
jgi:UDP-N-acetyl-2-amino-2-deoxyglucuronate dehydrogenase